ncbi:hypothetical protein Hanom_Chr11g01006081 [Helianthus anomalus]
MSVVMKIYLFCDQATYNCCITICKFYTMVVEVLLSEPRFSAAEVELEEDAPLVLLANFPLSKALWYRSPKTKKACAHVT